MICGDRNKVRLSQIGKNGKPQNYPNASCGKQFNKTVNEHDAKFTEKYKHKPIVATK